MLYIFKIPYVSKSDADKLLSKELFRHNLVTCTTN